MEGRIYAATGGASQEVGRQIGNHQTAKHKLPQETTGDQFRFERRSHRRQDSGLGCPKANQEEGQMAPGENPAQAPGGKNPTQESPRRAWAWEAKPTKGYIAKEAPF